MRLYVSRESVVDGGSRADRDSSCVRERGRSYVLVRTGSDWIAAKESVRREVGREVKISEAVNYACGRACVSRVFFSRIEVWSMRKKWRKGLEVTSINSLSSSTSLSSDACVCVSTGFMAFLRPLVARFLAGFVGCVRRWISTPERHSRKVSWLSSCSVVMGEVFCIL